MNSSKENKILVVDDAKSVANHIQSLLESQYTVKAVYSGEEALKIIPSFRPDLILLDTVMPGMDGYEVCSRVRKNSSLGLVKIIMISSRKKLEERMKGYEAGIDDHIGKPFEPEELLAKVNVFLRLKSVEDELHALNEKLNDQVKIRTQQLVDAEKMAVIGRNTAGIVHNLNNPLHVVMGLSNLLALEHPENNEIISLNKAALKMKEIISTILITSRKQIQEHMTKIDLNQVVQEQLALLESSSFFKHKVETNTVYGELPVFNGIYAHFSQSIGNLLKNALDAMYDKTLCVLTVSTTVENNYINIRIKDTGGGIPDEEMDKLFDPFFSTKPLVSEGDAPTGTGLGLPYCKEIIESYGGRIDVESQLNKGSCFTIQVPAETKD